MGSGDAAACRLMASSLADRRRRRSASSGSRSGWCRVPPSPRWSRPPRPPAADDAATATASSPVSTDASTAREGEARGGERERQAGNGGEHGAWRRGAQKRRRERGDTPAIRASSSSEVASRAAAAALEDMPRELRVWRARARFEQKTKKPRRAALSTWRLAAAPRRRRAKGTCKGRLHAFFPRGALSSRRQLADVAARGLADD
jgi:hypothetical protein